MGLPPVDADWWNIPVLCADATTAAPVKPKRAPQPENPATPTLTRDGYYTVPPLKLLRRLGDGQLAALERFVVGREDYGEVQFLQVRLATRHACQIPWLGAVP
jgi:Nucleoporin autopeptidase